MMQDRGNPLEWGFKSCTERESVGVLTVCRQKLKCAPGLKSKGEFIREGIMPHRQSNLFSET